MKPYRQEKRQILRHPLRWWHDLQPPITRHHYHVVWGPIAIVLFLALFILFSIYNFALLGYTLQPTRTTDPNSTLSVPYWFNRWYFTFGDDQLAPTCQEEMLQIGDQFKTTNLGLSYVIRQISDAYDETRTPQQYSAATYLNNTLENCHINAVDFFLRKADQSQQDEMRWYSWMFNYANIDAQCDITNDLGTLTLRFSSIYDRPNRVYDFVAVDNYTTHASVWWGTRLLDNYFRDMAQVLTTLKPRDGSVSNGQITYKIISDKSMRSYDMFDISWYFLMSSAMIANGPDNNTKQSELYNNSRRGESAPLTEGAMFSKIFSSLVLLDLGQSKLPNLLLDADSVKYALNPTDDYNRQGNGPLNVTHPEMQRWRGIAPPGKQSSAFSAPINSVPMSQCYDEFKSAMGPLGTKAASIYTQYSCNVPKRKGALTIVIQVLIADIVLIETCYALGSYLRGKLVAKKTHTALPQTDDALRSPLDRTESLKRTYSVTSSKRGLLSSKEMDAENYTY